MSSNQNTKIENWWDKLPRPEWSQFKQIEQSQDWFEVYEVLHGIFAIYEPGHWEKVISYLITGSERALLFDTGMGIGDIKKLVTELTDLDVILLNSHTHYDHIGGNHQFSEIYGTGTDFSELNSRGIPNEEARKFILEGSIWKETPDRFSHDTYELRPFKITKIVTDLDRIDLGGRVLEILLTPGHAPDALCLIDREKRVLFTGDTFYPAPLYAHLPGSDFDAYVKTATRLYSISDQVDHLLTAHNVARVSSEYLTKLHEAFSSIMEDKADFEVKDGNREYPFDGFSIIVKDTPDPTNKKY